LDRWRRCVGALGSRARCSRELAWAEEEAERHAAARVVHRMSVADPAEPREAAEPRDGQATVHQPVVDDDVRETEQRHSGTRADEHGGDEPMHVAANHHEAGRDGGVQGRERVVTLPPAASARMVRPMNRPQPPVPDAAVQEARPGLHQGRDDQRDGDANSDEGGRAHRVAS